MQTFPGDFFSIHTLVLPRPACGYGVQKLGSDLLLGPEGTALTPVRNANQEHLFETFDEAAKAGHAYLANHHTECPLVIVPLGFDPIFERLVLIQGVIQTDEPTLN